MNPMKKILVIGEGGNFLKDFVAQYAQQNVLVDVICFSGAEEIRGARKQKNCATSSKPGLPLVGQQLELYQRIRKALKEVDNTYDCIVIHFVFFFLAPHISKLRSLTKNLVAVVWGSDFYRTRFFRSLFQDVIYRTADSIVFTNPLTREAFIQKKPPFLKKPLKIARFGLPVLDEIKKIRARAIDRNTLCETFGLPCDKVIILVGYNANPAQRQLFVINEFSKLSPEVKSFAHLVFPLGYGGAAIEKKIRELLLENRISNYSILNKFYDYPNTARLRCITDVLVNIQPSDQFSGTMQETLYAGGRVIAGKWLPYQDVVATGAPIRLIDRLELVGTAIKEEIQTGINSHDFACNALRQFIDDSSSWATNKKIWDEILLSETS